MPTHTWLCDRCKAEVDVLRSIHEPGDPPRPDEVQPDASGTACEHMWRKVLRGAPAAARAPGWGRKGAWIVLIGIFGHALLR